MNQEALTYARTLARGNFHNRPNYGQIRAELMRMFDISRDEAEAITKASFTA